MVPEALGIVVAHGYVGEMVTQNLFGTAIYLKNCEYFTIKPEEIPNFMGKCGVVYEESFIDKADAEL